MQQKSSFNGVKGHHPYSRSFQGVPYFKINVEYALYLMKTVYLKYPQNPDESFRIIISMNESVVTRCGVLTSMFIAICLFIVTRPSVLSHEWQQWLFYSLLFIWSGFIVNLMWSLRHQLPYPWDFGTENDLDFTIRLYFMRMRRYNEALLVTCICFILILFLIAPITAELADVIFKQP
jgi:hypothetical protein